MSLSLGSSDFSAGGSIPVEHTCDGADRSPSLSWPGMPAATKSLALVIDELVDLRKNLNDSEGA